jgi:hypothetical protein
MVIHSGLSRKAQITYICTFIVNTLMGRDGDPPYILFSGSEKLPLLEF